MKTLTVTDSEANPSVNRKLLATADSLTRNVTTSQGLVYEGKWLDDAFVGIYGWRKDISKSSADSASIGDANDQQSINFQNISLSNPGATLGRVEVQSRSYSLVAHLDELPGLKNYASKLPIQVSLDYDVSTNFQPDSSRVDINGDPLAPPSGKTIERGILLETRDGKYSLKINRYVTTIANGEYAGGTSFASDLANWVGNTMYFANVFFYRTSQGQLQTPASGLAPNPGIGTHTQNADPSTEVGNVNYNNGASAAGYYFIDVPQTAGNNPPIAGRDYGFHTAAMDALQISSTTAARAWETQVNTDFPNFFKQWGFNSLSEVQAGTVTRSQLTSAPGETNFALTQSSQSKGWEMELDANPTPNWRIALNATKTDAEVTQLGDPALAKFMAETSAAVFTPGVLGQTQWFWGNTISPGVPNAKDAFFNNYNGFAPLGTTYAGLQQSQGIPVTQLAKWRYNLTTNYDFTHGVVKGVNVGGGVRYSSSEILGYAPIGNGLGLPPFLIDPTKPERSPSETYFDLWVGYKHKLTGKINWNIQLNVANLGKGNYLIPVNYQAPINGVVQPATYRIGPTQTFTLTNRFEF